MRKLAVFWIMCWLGMASVVHAEPAQHWSVGLHHMAFADPLDARPVQALAFYPSSGPERSSRIDGYRVDAVAGAPIAIGRYPLLMLSHGNTGTPLALHDLATALARRGFIVVAVTHPGDNAHDHSRLGTLSNLYGRPLQISAAITASLADPLLSPYVDGKQVGMIGYSAGGETALILSGAEPDLERLRRYCEERPQDADACKTQGVLIADRDDLGAEADPRIHALLLMAPLSLMFGRQALAHVKVPALIYSGDNDQLLAIDKNAQALARKLPVAPNYRLLAGAGHFVFMAPCDDEQREHMAALCNDPEGVDREGIHLSLQSEAAHFFNRTLKHPGRAGLNTANQ
ncbi:dienelactone hydrolase [Pseudomonas alkylphenolica]|uniref:Dienelactone hydrolase n=1 Tax=Pseudomonas alkylphenolica TaxID=237609 RepID=A0A443ZIU9_9PSED|nr:dienelactone hydrolase [Pseudomonas alkylphenolica]RWU18864.1 dienelactone hydrolase [Pseudomonas alkylphenolica]